MTTVDRTQLILSAFTVGPKADHTASRGPAHTELRTANKSVRLAGRTVVEAALRAQVEAEQSEVRFPQDSLSRQTVMG